MPILVKGELLVASLQLNINKRLSLSNIQKIIPPYEQPQA